MMSRIIEDSASPGIALSAAALVGMAVAMLASTTIGPALSTIAGLIAGIAAFVGLRGRSWFQRRTERFKEGDTVRTSPAAVEQFRPGQTGRIREFRDDPHIDGKLLCLVEYPDGSTAEVPEIFLERVGTSSSSAR